VILFQDHQNINHHWYLSINLLAWVGDASLFLNLSLCPVKGQRVCAVVDNKGVFMVLFIPLWPCIKGKEKGSIAEEEKCAEDRCREREDTLRSKRYNENCSKYKMIKIKVGLVEWMDGKRVSLSHLCLGQVTS